MPDSDKPPLRCQLHEGRIEALEKGMTDLQQEVHVGFARVTTDTERIYKSLVHFKEKVLGNGDVGELDKHAARIAELEIARRIEEQVAEAVGGRQSITQRVKGTQLYAWVLVLMVLGPKGVEILIETIQALHGLWGGGG